ncbi:MAG: metallophosphoesterase family protein [Elusimicrobiota bacterium]
MLYGIISDIHGNYNAAKAVMSFLKEKNVDRIINCGDIVGYGPEPNKCINLIRNNSDLYTVIGNHDHAVIDYKNAYHFNPMASRAVKWTRNHITSENLNFLSAQDYKKEEDNFMFVHGSPRAPMSEYVLDISVAYINFKKIEKQICFIGHTHFPACFEQNRHKRVRIKEFTPDKMVKIKDNYRYIINAGSVGQPRDGDPKACACLYDTDSQKVSLHRIKYNIEDTQNKILSEKLPKFLAQRLTRGK